MVTGVEAVTALVFTENVALVDPAATVTLDGTVAEVLLLERLTVTPPLGAAPLRVTVPVEGDPPVTLLGLSEIEVSVGLDEEGITVREAGPRTPPFASTTLFGSEAVTALVFTENVALVDPAATVTLDGTVAEVLLLERFTVTPPLGAAPLRVTVPVEGDPPVTLLGLSVIAESTGDAGLWTVP